MRTLQAGRLNVSQSHHRGTWCIGAGVVATAGLVGVGLGRRRAYGSPDLAAVLYATGFFALFLAVMMLVVGVLDGRGDRLTTIPVTWLGWVALAAFVVGLVFEFIGLVMLGLWVFGAAAVVTLGAILVGRERALAVLGLPLLSAAFAVASLATELTLGHG